MIGHWPDPLPDELLYSACARFDEQGASPSRRFVVAELFGPGSALAVVDLPGHLDHLIAALPSGHGYSADLLIERHTTFPFYEPFLTAERAADVRAAMRGEGGQGVHLRLGLMAGRVPAPVWLRSCPGCVREDRERHGEAYWHRLHQIAGVEICPHHQLFLENTDVRRLSPRTRHGYVTAESSTRRADPVRSFEVGNPCHRLLLRLARSAAWLLEQGGDCRPGPALLRERYVEALAGRGLASYGGRLHLEELTEEFVAHVGTGALGLLGCELNRESRQKGGWLGRLLRAPRNAQNPLRHLLLMDFLGEGAAWLLPWASAPGAGAFGPGPWPCLNPVCRDHGRPVIPHVTIAHHAERKRPVGEFGCPHCGFTYVRHGPDRTGERRHVRDAVRDHGPVWRERLIALWADPKVSLRAIARALDVDPLTAKRHALDLGLSFPRQASARPSRVPHSPHRVKRPPGPVRDDRAAWLAALAEHPATPSKMLRAELPALYARLYRQDRAWLAVHQPSVSGRKDPAAGQPRAAWAQRDATLSARVGAAAVHLRSTSGRSRQVTATALGRELAALTILQKHPDKLPLTAAAIAREAESRTDYARRRVGWAVEEFRREGICPQGRQLVRRAGLRPEMAALPEVASALLSGLITLGWEPAVLAPERAPDRRRAA